MSAPGKLAAIVSAVRARAARRRELQPLALLERSVHADGARRRRFVDALARPHLTFIAELKRRSPSAGSLQPEQDGSLEARADAYRAGGADALSVLTETDHFGGSLDDLSALGRLPLPRLRKDFVLDEGMVLESALYGADAVLLIAALLAPDVLAHLRRCAGELGLAVLLEVHDEHELERALTLEPDLLGVNARDLTTLAIDLGTFECLLPRIPHGPLRVAESGMRTLADLQRARAAGADVVLVGEALMQSADPAATLGAWKESLRAR